MSALVFSRNGDVLTTTEIVAVGVGIQHKNIIALVRTYRNDFEEFGNVRFETRGVNGTAGFANYALLNEQQATLLVTYCKNTEIVRKFKVALVKAFYEARLPASCPATITPAEQLQIQQAVARRAKTSSANYQTIYRAIKVRFQIPRYNELPRCQFAECLKFIDAVDLKVPEAKTAAAPVFENPFTPEELAASPEKPPKGYAYRVSAEFLDNQRMFVYYWRYLFRRELELFEEFLYRTESPRAARFHEAVHNMNLTGIEDQLRRLGFPMDGLPCYRHYVGRLTAA